MLLGRDYWNTGYRLFHSTPDAIPGGEIPETDEDIDKLEGVEDAGKSALKKERQARRDAVKAFKDTNATLDTVKQQMADLQKRLDAKDDAEQKARDKAAKEGGDFQKLADKYEGERDQLKADLDALQTRYDALNASAQTIVKSDFETIPEAIRALYTGPADDVVEMLKFVPKAKEAAKALPGGEEPPNSSNVRGAEEPPKGGPNVTPESKAADDERAKAAMARGYF
jgi:chromosome segregation ATPase